MLQLQANNLQQFHALCMLQTGSIYHARSLDYAGLDPQPVDMLFCIANP
jgi:hypothetical protein